MAWHPLLHTTTDLGHGVSGTTLGTHVNFYVDTILTDPGFNAENVSATPPDLAPVMSRSYVAQ